MLRGSVYLPILWYRWLSLVIGTAGYLAGGQTMSGWAIIVLGAAILYNLVVTGLVVLRRTSRWHWMISVVVDTAAGGLLIALTGGTASPFLLYYLTPVLETALRSSLPVSVGVTVGLGLLYPFLVVWTDKDRWAALLSTAFLTGEGVIFLLALLVILLIGPVLRWREQEGALARYEYLFSLAGTQRAGVISAITEEVIRSLDADVALVFLHDPSNTHLGLQVPDPYPMTTLSRSVLQRLEWDQEFLRHLMSVEVPALLVDGQFDRFPVPQSVQDFFLRQPFLSAALVLEGSTIGLLLAGRRRARTSFAISELSPMAELASRAARLIGWTESLSSLRRRYAETSALNQVLREINSPRRLEDVLQQIARSACEVFLLDRASVMLLDESGKWLRVRAVEGVPFGRPVTEGVPVGRGVSGWVAQHGQPLIIAPDNVARFRSQEEREVRQALCIPLRTDGQVIGVLNLSILSSGERSLAHEDIQLAQALADAAAVAIVKADLMEKVLTRTRELAQVNRELSTEHRKLEWTISCIAEGVVVLDALNRLILLNDASTCLLNLEGKSVLGTDAAAYLKKEGLEELLALLQRCHQEATTLSSPLTYRGPLQAGGTHLFEVQMTPVCSEEGGQQRCEGVVAIFRDVTVQVEEEQVRSGFITTLSQDIRTPLTSIKGYLDLLRSKEAGPLTSQQEEFLTRSTYNIDHCINRVNNFLDLARIQEGHLSLYFEPVDVPQLIHEAVGLTRKQAEMRKQEVHLNVPAHLEPIVASRVGLRQVLISLLDNAIKHTSIQGQVFVRVDDEGDQVKFAVQDTGVGISEEMRGKIFQSGRPGEARAGIGLGLYLSKQIVEAHGGTIWLESEPGKGSVFYFTLPKGPAQRQPSQGVQG